jgi:hypothetical protein
MPGFERILQREHGDLNAYYADVAAMRKLSIQGREEALRTR